MEAGPGGDSLLPDGWLSSLPRARKAWRTRGPGGDGIDPDDDAPGVCVRICLVWRGSTYGGGGGLGSVLQAWGRGERGVIIHSAFLQSSEWDAVICHVGLWGSSLPLPPECGSPAAL